MLGPSSTHDPMSLSAHLPECPSPLPRTVNLDEGQFRLSTVGGPRKVGAANVMRSWGRFCTSFLTVRSVGNYTFNSRAFHFV